ncbi:MAG: beta-N-acetylhexosaminidase [Bdellovibrionota bacterium]
MGTLEDIEKKVGQLLIVGIPEKSFDSEVLNTFVRIGIGGVILFKHNYESPEQLVALTNTIQKNMIPASYRGHPTWIAVDQEGGRVQRFKDPFTVMPAAVKWSALNSPKTCFEAGFIMGKELRACGINLNFAPVADVLQTEAKAIGDRSFSSDPQVVATLASAVVRGIQKAGVLAVAKHFPGHGSVIPDSHEELPVSPKTVEQLEEIDWIPFRRAIRSRVEGIMSAHILFENIDPGRPATLSRKLLQDYLRKELRFTKLIFSDDLEMGAIKKKYELRDAAFLALQAGCDQLIFGHEWEKIEDVWAHLSKAFRDGALPLARLDESIARITELKMKYLSPYRNATLEDVKAFVGHPSHKMIAEAIAAGVVPESILEDDDD